MHIRPSADAIFMCMYETKLYLVSGHGFMVNVPVCVCVRVMRVCLCARTLIHNSRTLATVRRRAEPVARQSHRPLLLLANPSHRHQAWARLQPPRRLQQQLLK